VEITDCPSAGSVSAVNKANVENAHPRPQDIKISFPEYLPIWSPRKVATGMSLSPNAVPDANGILWHPIASELAQVGHVVEVQGRPQEEMVSQIPTHSGSEVLLKVIGSRAAWDLSAGLVVSWRETYARASDARAEFWQQLLGRELGRPENGINVVEYRTVWDGSIIALRGPPRYFRANAYTLSHENAGADVSKQAPQAGRFIQVSVAKGLDLGAVRPVVGAAEPQVRRYFLRAQRPHRCKGEHENYSRVENRSHTLTSS
jgi:hypothetical protein